eukprot:CAMPEP_0185589970 /NCGR_PEP_ID=MMETSP0434-20130131/58930_1 /TAXON_ID=626734 ORGANISM="Favella taraikaensis, Strain Fe Narragansett Bay" /NCGR_SAMPLE_ID=MMETSP0434 /ASSEMBLY_ACC=CAM_ASM_000379 /LENGTH=116 /DNA_ID=CAMNT_0028213765 /DNA_START=1 /DNA_END=347 /DNA_ORIENTATION=+
MKAKKAKETAAKEEVEAFDAVNPMVAARRAAAGGKAAGESKADDADARGKSRLLKRQGSTVLALNPMMAGGAVKNVVALSEDDLKATNMPVELPHDSVYQQFAKRFQQMEQEMVEA